MSTTKTEEPRKVTVTFNDDSQLDYENVIHVERTRHEYLIYQTDRMSRLNPDFVIAITDHKAHIPVRITWAGQPRGPLIPGAVLGGPYAV